MEYVYWLYADHFIKGFEHLRILVSTEDPETRTPQIPQGWLCIRKVVVVQLYLCMYILPNSYAFNRYVGSWAWRKKCPGTMWSETQILFPRAFKAAGHLK